MNRHGRCLAACAGTAFLLLLLAGCQWGALEEWFRKKPPPEPKPEPVAAAEKDPVLAGSVASKSLLASVEPLQLRGFGLVVGLGENGSSDCPTAIREYLVEFMNREYGPKGSVDQPRKFSAEKLIDSLDTAVVEVTGYVPAGAAKGARFDLHVEALAGTSTRSLVGGLLLPCEMRVYTAAVDRAGLLAGDALAEANGPVFVNPFGTDGKASAETDPRRGAVLGGGRSKHERSARLVLSEPSYSDARRIQRRLNERFGQKPQAAEAMSRAYVVLHTPPQYSANPAHFLQLAPRVYLEDHASYLEQQTRELARLILLPGIDCDKVALALEALGRRCISHVQPLYAHEDVNVRFYAARTGARLADTTAVTTLGDIATSDSPQRLLAVRELGRSDSAQAPIRLLPLLNCPDQEVRIAAYEGLLRHRHPAVRSIPFKLALDNGQVNFVLDVIESAEKPLIHVRRTRLARIAVFGSRLPVTLPVFHALPDDSLTINGDAGGEINLLAKRRGRLADQLSVPPRVTDLIVALADLPVKDETGRPRGLGLTYSQVVQVLAALTRDGSIGAPLVLEQASTAELLGPDQTQERPETDAEEAPRSLPQLPAEPAGRPEAEKGPADR